MVFSVMMFVLQI